MTIRAIYENGIFRPLDPVDLPEKTAVDITISMRVPLKDVNQREIFAILLQSSPSNEIDVAECHNEHQP